MYSIGWAEVRGMLYWHEEELQVLAGHVPYKEIGSFYLKPGYQAVSTW